MSAEVRKEFVHRKRQVELQRVLLPNAPPRKRQARRPSPDRDPCPLLEPEEREVEIEHELETEPSKIELETEPEPEPEPEPQPQPDIDPEPQVIEYENMDFIIVGAEVEVKSRSAKTSLRTSINATDAAFDRTVENWLQDEDSDDDLDVNFDDNDIYIPFIRSAATEPACDADMTELETQVLRTEDELNDRILRDLVTDQDHYNFDWKKDRKNFTGRREIFTGISGPTFDRTNKTPVDIFYKMFDIHFIDRLCTETNPYAEQKIARLTAENKMLPTSRLHRWTPTNCDEMITFLAVLILQGLYPLPEEEKYFSFNGFGTMPYFSRIMSYNRFTLLKSLYHFVDNETLTDRTKLGKIQPVLDYLNEKFSTLYMPSQEIAIDESLLKWHGRLSFAQKIATKAAQVGVKTYELCESHSGYLWKFFVYVGKNSQGTPTDNRR
ncbi:uncharacterized protein [Epargyreus clarus]|uniref:uncharacterized protein n=1 Tax=Epargyreus clarus TaxID=520877 RepID=UPI003C2C802D